MSTFEIDYRRFERLPQIQYISNTLHFKMEEVVETLYTPDVDISTANSMIDTIVNINFGNIFHHQNGPNQHQHVYKIKVNSINTYPIKYQVPHQLYT